MLSANEIGWIVILVVEGVFLAIAVALAYQLLKAE
jgi:hypothetical protein